MKKTMTRTAVVVAIAVLVVIPFGFPLIALGAKAIKKHWG